MSRFCEGCGHPMEDNAQFCDKCGHRVSRPVQATPRPSVPPQPRPVAPARAPVPGKKSRVGLYIGLGAGAVALLLLVAVLVSAFSNPKMELIPFPDSLKVSGETKVNCQYTNLDTIIPANYRSIDNIVFMTCWTDAGRAQLMVSVEIPGFSQKYEQLIDVSRAETELSIHPPLLADAAKNLGSSKDAQLIVTVRDETTGKTIVQDTKPVRLYSRNDIQWAAPDGTPFEENILAWVTPEAEEIDMMLRSAADSANSLYGMSSIVGYQKYSNWSEAEITYAQVNAMMYTLANTYGVKYIMAPFSATGAQLQSVKTPAEVINNAAGLCVETAVTMASAIQRTNMHAMIILLPGHAQVAVETWANSGEYFLIETTALESAKSGNFDNTVIFYFTKEQWTQKMAQEGYTAIDCDLAEKLHIQTID